MSLKKLGPDDPEKAIDSGVAVVSGFAGMIHPLLGVAVDLAVAYFGPAIERRQERAKALIQFVDDHIAAFGQEVLADKVFQVGFVFLMEKYIRERNDDKRLILQKVLLGYVKAPSLLDYPLEEMVDLVGRMRMSDTAILSEALRQERLSDRSNANDSFMLRKDPNAVSRLVYFGLLHEDRSKNGPHVREQSDMSFLYVRVSPAGHAFAEYITQV